MLLNIYGSFKIINNRILITQIQYLNSKQIKKVKPFRKMQAQGFKETVSGAANQNRLLIDPNAQPLPMPTTPGFGGQSLQILSPSGNTKNSYQTKVGRQSQWTQLHRKQHKTESELLIPGFEVRRDTMSYLINIKGIEGVPHVEKNAAAAGINLPMSVANYSLQYYATLFNKDLGGFYGRTYTSQCFNLKQTGTGQWDLKQDEFIYLHTSFRERTSFLVVECVIKRELPGSVTFSSAGYAILDIFAFNGPTFVDLIQGTPRSIGTLGLEAARGKPAGRISFDMKDFPQYDKIKSLIPQNCLCGMEEEVPGLVNDMFPNPKGGPQNQGRAVLDLQLHPRATLYIHNIQMITSTAFETNFENFLKRLRQEKLTSHNKGDASTIVNKNVFIDERRIIVSVNNTWKNIQEDAYLSMSAPTPAGLSSGSGSLTIKNFIKHPLVALIFRVEYRATIPMTDYNEQMFFTLGWTIHLPDFNAAGELADTPIETNFTMGPGISPQGELLWDPNSQDSNFYQLKMKAFVSVSATPPAIAKPGQPPATVTAPKPAQPLGAGAPRPVGVPPQQHQVTHHPQFAQSYGRNPSQPAPQAMQDPAVILALQEKEALIKQQEQREQELQRQIFAIQKQAEQLEMERLRGSGGNQYGGQPNYNNQAMMQQTMKEKSMEKAMLENQIAQMRNDQKAYMDAMMEAQRVHQMQISQQSNFYQPGQTAQTGFYSDGSSGSHIASIQNMFYNMLNLLGEKEGDRRVLGLAESVKQTMTSTRYDDLLAPKVPFVGFHKVNLLKTTDLPQLDQVNFIKHGLGDQLKHASAQITSDGFQKDQIMMNIEAEDPLKASTITFKFICFKTPWGGIERVPRKFFFSFKFFTFPTVKTGTVQIKNQNEHDSQGLKGGQPYYLSRVSPQAQIRNQVKSESTMNDPNLLSVTFNIDPSVSKIDNENLRLCEYLYDRFLTVDVFDAESLFLYGTCKLPLFELLRQARGSVVRAKECEMCDPDSGDMRGAIQLIMTHAGNSPSVVVKSDPTGTASSFYNEKKRTQPTQGMEGQKTKKIVKSKPMDLTQMQGTNNPTAAIASGAPNVVGQTLINQMTQDELNSVSANNADLRKKLRVDRIRKMTAGTQSSNTGGHQQLTSMQFSIEDSTQPDWLKLKSLREIEIFRETKKNHMITKVMEEYVSGAEQLSVMPGQLSFVKVKLHNKFSQREIFTIHINDPDEKNLFQKEMTMVIDHQEWRHWVSREKCAAPSSYEVMTETGDVDLKPNEEVEVLFKFITVRDTPVLAQDFSMYPPQAYIRPRKIQLIVLNSNKQPYSNTEVQVVPCSAPIDHTFRYYEPQNSHVNLTVPPFLFMDQLGLHATVSKPNAYVEIQRKTGVMTVQTKTEDENSVSDIILFVYRDSYKEFLMATIQLEVHSMVTLYSKIKAGLQTMQNLALPAENARSVMLHSSDPNLVYLPRKERNRTFRIIPQTINHMQICVKTYRPTQQRIQVHCTDVNTNELVHSWLLIVDADQPHINQTHDVFVKMQHMSVWQLEFVNKLNMPTIYEFASSDEKIVVPKMPQVKFEAKEFKMIDLHFLPLQDNGTYAVFIYANDIDHNVVECYKLDVKCIV